MKFDYLNTTMDTILSDDVLDLKYTGNEIKDETIKAVYNFKNYCTNIKEFYFRNLSYDYIDVCVRELFLDDITVARILAMILLCNYFKNYPKNGIREKLEEFRPTLEGWIQVNGGWERLIKEFNNKKVFNNKKEFNNKKLKFSKTLLILGCVIIGFLLKDEIIC